jgi:hypothetical protein
MNEKNGAIKSSRGGTAVEERRCMTNMLINFVVSAGFVVIQEAVCVSVVKKLPETRTFADTKKIKVRAYIRNSSRDPSKAPIESKE